MIPDTWREAAKHLWLIAVVSLLFWTFTWLLALAVLPFDGSAVFAYLLFGVLEPIPFALLLCCGRPARFVTTILLMFVLFSFVAHIVAFILRVIDIETPFTLSQTREVLFAILELFAVFMYILYSLAAYRLYRMLGARDDTNKDS